MEEPRVEVGIMSGEEIRFVFRTAYYFNGKECRGRQLAVYSGGKICWNGEFFDELLFETGTEMNASFELLDVTIGVGFHWERKENQVFSGNLKLIIEGGRLVAVNVVPVETYLISVISSEMSATASLELLKAHAVISRSWLLNIMENGKIEENTKPHGGRIQSLPDDTSEQIVWYDHQAHTRFHVCADDHCQRYQGITRASDPKVLRAVHETRGRVLKYENQICDARFSKCCGGMMEEFRYCWEDKEVPYLQAVGDNAVIVLPQPDLTKEPEAAKWIRTSPDAFCNTSDKNILSQVLNKYDYETTDFYRWKVRYTQKELSELVCKRSGIDFGTVLDLQPVERGKSGRLVKLRIVGAKRTVVIGKELEIRRILSSSHLYSSAFVIDREGDDYILTGAGWGHGVGLCQIGAAVMGEEGYAYDKILLHYYVGASIENIYEK